LRKTKAMMLMIWTLSLILKPPRIEPTKTTTPRTMTILSVLSTILYGSFYLSDVPALILDTMQESELHLGNIHIEFAMDENEQAGGGTQAGRPTRGTELIRSINY
jgi:hypothetical protein